MADAFTHPRNCFAVFKTGAVISWKPHLRPIQTLVESIWLRYNLLKNHLHSFHSKIPPESSISRKKNLLISNPFTVRTNVFIGSNILSRSTYYLLVHSYLTCGDLGVINELRKNLKVIIGRPNLYQSQ